MAVGIDDAPERVFALKDLGVALAKSGEASEAMRIAALISGTTGAENWRGSGIAQVAEALASADDADGAEAVAEGIEDPIRRNQALAEVAVALASAGQLAEAERIARRVEDAAWRAVALAAVAARS